MNPEPIIHSEVSQNKKNKYILMQICGIYGRMVLINLFAEQQRRCRLKRTDLGTKVGEKRERVRSMERE